MAEQKYKNIPVKPEIYAQVQLISEANGFGERGLGAQIAHWVGRELPECDHKKQSVEIEYFTDTAAPLGRNLKRVGYYCSTCKRVYAKINEAELVLEDGKKLLKAVKLKA
ncbi:MAG: hypothetical protein ABI904_23755 [Chloroflexota bacterium]